MVSKQATDNATNETMVLAMFKKRKNQTKAEPKAEPKTKPQPPPSSPPNALPDASPNPQHSAILGATTTTSTNTTSASDSDDEIAMFAKQSGIPESIVRIEFKIIQSLYNASHKDIIDKYHTLPVPALLPILKLRYIRNFWKQLNQNKT